VSDKDSEKPRDCGEKAYEQGKLQEASKTVERDGFLLGKNGRGFGKPDKWLYFWDKCLSYEKENPSQL